LVAAQKTARRGYLIELDPLYVDLIIRRFEQLTGEMAVHAESGSTFIQIQTERASEDAAAPEVMAALGGRIVVGEYDVGWGKTPVGNRFKKSQSGNPKDRTRGTRNLQTDLKEDLGEKIVVQQGGQTIRISKPHALVKALIAKSVTGNTRAIQILINMMHRKTADDDIAKEAPMLSAEENELWQGLLKEVLSEQASPSNLSAKAEEDGDES
jgi:hypothetical protein